MTGHPARAGAVAGLRAHGGAYGRLSREQVGLGAATFRAHDGNIVCGCGVSTPRTRQRVNEDLGGETKAQEGTGRRCGGQARHSDSPDVMEQGPEEEGLPTKRSRP